jgi:hypothetical protein
MFLCKASLDDSDMSVNNVGEVNYLLYSVDNSDGIGKSANSFDSGIQFRMFGFFFLLWMAMISILCTRYIGYLISLYNCHQGDGGSQRN